MIGELSIEIETEVRWDEVTSWAQELQDADSVYAISIRRSGGRVAAGGPGYDIIPVLILITLTATITSLVQESVRDVIYPFLKDKLYVLYSRLPGTTASGSVKPLGITMKDGDLEVRYRFSEGLAQKQFDEALRAIPEHFETVKDRGAGVLMLDYDGPSAEWVENKEAGEFLTWVKTRRE